MRKNAVNGQDKTRKSIASAVLFCLYRCAAHILQLFSSYKLELSAAAISKFQVARSTIPVGFRAVRL